MELLDSSPEGSKDLPLGINDYVVGIAVNNKAKQLAVRVHERGNDPVGVSRRDVLKIFAVPGLELVSSTLLADTAGSFPFRECIAWMGTDDDDGGDIDTDLVVLDGRNFTALALVVPDGNHRRVSPVVTDGLDDSDDPDGPDGPRIYGIVGAKDLIVAKVSMPLVPMKRLALYRRSYGNTTWTRIVVEFETPYSWAMCALPGSSIVVGAGVEAAEAAEENHGTGSMWVLNTDSMEVVYFRVTCELPQDADASPWATYPCFLSPLSSTSLLLVVRSSCFFGMVEVQLGDQFRPPVVPMQRYADTWLDDRVGAAVSDVRVIDDVGVCIVKGDYKATIIAFNPH